MTIIVTPNKEEQSMFEAIASNATGRILAGYISRLISTLADIRTLEIEDKTSQIAGRQAAIDILKINILDKLSTLKGNEPKLEEDEQYE